MKHRLTSIEFLDHGPDVRLLTFTPLDDQGKLLGYDEQEQCSGESMPVPIGWGEIGLVKMQASQTYIDREQLRLGKDYSLNPQT